MLFADGYRHRLFPYSRRNGALIFLGHSSVTFHRMNSTTRAREAHREKKDTFNVVLACEDASAGQRAMQAYEQRNNMTKTLDTIHEAVRNPKLLFRRTHHRREKILKHRYERRKIRECLHLGGWLFQEAT